MKKLKLSLTLLLSVAAMAIACAQPIVPIALENNSDFSDDQIYVALIGQYNGSYIWLNLASNDASGSGITDVDPQYNTMEKNGSYYGNIFTKLSDISDKTIYVTGITAARIFFSFGSPMYIRLDDNGYAGADLQNPSDPNAGIRWEIAEFSNASNGMWLNTTRVDAFQYPMGVELWGAEGANNAYMKAGDMLSHSQMIAKWQSQLGSDSDFAVCLREGVITYDSMGAIIEQPSKLSSFKSGGASEYYFQSYIDAVWDYFTTHTLTCDQGERGIWTGKVVDGKLVMTSSWGGGTTAYIHSKPTTQAVIEGKDALATGGTQDLALQAQFCGAMTRGVVQLTEDLQDWGDQSKFFQNLGYNVYNKYVWFFHQNDVSYDGKTYAFAYDDTFDQSSTLVTSIPSKAKITIGGFAGQGSATDDSGSDDSGSVSSAYDYIVICRDELPDGEVVDLRNISLYTWAGTMTLTNAQETYEGSSAISFDINAYTGTWFGAGYNSSDASVSLSDLQDYSLHFAYKTDYSGTLAVKLGDATGAEYAVEFEHVADNSWHMASIPMSDFAAKGFNFSSTGVTNWLAFSIVGEGTVSTGNYIALDNIYYAKQSLEAETAVSDYVVICRDELPDGEVVDLRNISLYTWAGTMTLTNAQETYEGSSAISFDINAYTGGWFGAGYNTEETAVDLTKLEGSTLNFAYKTDYSGTLAVKLSDATGAEYSVEFEHIADNYWHTASIPMSDFAAKGFYFSSNSVTNWLAFSIVSEYVVSIGNSISLDNIYYEKVQQTDSSDDAADDDMIATSNPNGNGTTSDSTNGVQVQYAYNFAYENGSLIVSFDVENVNEFAGLVTEIIDLTDGRYASTFVTSSSASASYGGYYPGQTVTFKAKWMYAGGDAYSEEITYTISITAGVEDSADAATVYSSNGRIYCDAETYAIYNLAGQDVTDRNGSLHGLYIVVADGNVVKVRVN